MGRNNSYTLKKDKKFANEIMSFPVFSDRDYRALVSMIVQKYLSSGYVLPYMIATEGNEYIDGIRVKNRLTDAVILTKPIRKSDDFAKLRNVVGRPSGIVELIVRENEATVLSRIFYKYGEGKLRTLGTFNDYKTCVRYCSSIEEWNSLAKRRNQRRNVLYTDSKSGITCAFLSEQTTPRWERIAERAASIVSRRRGYKNIKASDIESITYDSFSEKIFNSRVSRLKVSVHIKGKNAPFVCATDGYRGKS